MLPSPSPRKTTVKRTVEPRQADDYGHLQPQAPELERAVLGALMIETDAYARIADTLKPDSFYEVPNQKIFQAIQMLAFNEDPVDILTVTEKLRSMGELDNIGVWQQMQQENSRQRLARRHAPCRSNARGCSAARRR